MMFEVIQTCAGPAHLKRTGRKTLAISVLPDGRLELVAPHESRLEAILSKVEKRSRWIRAQRQSFLAMNAVRPAARFVSGATHRYLGRQYLLRVSTSSVTKVVLRGGFLHVQVKEKSDVSVKGALQSWYRAHAKAQFEARLKAWEPWCQDHRLAVPRLQLRSMAKRWGSALKNGTICLNPELVQAPAVCVDYVIAHEICHLKHPDHGREFWNLLSRLMPDWRQRKQRLESVEL